MKIMIGMSLKIPLPIKEVIAVVTQLSGFSGKFSENSLKRIKKCFYFSLPVVIEYLYWA
jgi:hypothetical protein